VRPISVVDSSILWNMVPRHWVNSAWYLETKWWSHLQGLKKSMTIQTTSTEISTLEDEITMLSSNVGYLSPSGMAAHHSRTATPYEAWTLTFNTCRYCTDRLMKTNIMTTSLCIYFTVLSASQTLCQYQEAQWMINWTGFGRKSSQSNWNTDPAFIFSFWKTRQLKFHN